MSAHSREIDPAGATVLEISTSGDAYIRGGAGGMIRLQSREMPIDEVAVRRLNDALQLESDGDLEVEVPSGLAIRLVEVSGDLEVSDLRNALEGRNISGDLWIRSAGDVVRIVTVGGDAMLESCQGQVTLESVGGDLVARDLRGGITAREVAGDLRLASDFATGCEYVAHAAGDARVVLLGDPTTASVSFVLQSDSGIDVHLPLADVEREPGTLRGRVGEGGATVHVKCDGLLQLGAAGEDDASERPRASYGDWTFDEWSKRVASRAESAARRAAAEAERHAEEAARHAEEVARQAAMHVEQAIRWWTEGTEERPDEPPPSSPRPTNLRDEQRLIVLRMLSEGKITTEEAERLLEALG